MRPGEFVNAEKIGSQRYFFGPGSPRSAFLGIYQPIYIFATTSREGPSTFTRHGGLSRAHVQSPPRIRPFLALPDPGRSRTRPRLPCADRPVLPPRPALDLPAGRGAGVDHRLLLT